jgi:hypothetical protein
MSTPDYLMQAKIVHSEQEIRGSTGKTKRFLSCVHSLVQSTEREELVNAVYTHKLADLIEKTVS